MRDIEALAYRLLHLEQQLDSYARLHTQELADMRTVLQELKDAICMLPQQQHPAPISVAPAHEGRTSIG